MVVRYGKQTRRPMLVLSHSDLGHGVVRKFRSLRNGRGFVWLWRLMNGSRICETRAEVELAGVIKDSFTATLQTLAGGTLLHFSLGKEGDDRLEIEIAARITGCSEEKKKKFARELICDIKRVLLSDKILILSCWTISCNEHRLSVTRFPIV